MINELFIVERCVECQSKKKTVLPFSRDITKYRTKRNILVQQQKVKSAGGKATFDCGAMVEPQTIRIDILYSPPTLLAPSALKHSSIWNRFYVGYPSSKCLGDFPRLADGNSTPTFSIDRPVRIQFFTFGFDFPPLSLCLPRNILLHARSTCWGFNRCDSLRLYNHGGGGAHTARMRNIKQVRRKHKMS